MTGTPSPFFVDPFKQEGGGVDFLGLRQVNLDFIAMLLPGINNVTNRIRPFSVMAWMAWAFKQEVEARSAAEASSKEFRRFREKVEVLFGWGHQLHGAGTGMVGNAQVPPGNGLGAVSLQFAAWQRRVSWLDAVFYGPSLKDDNGLGFIRQTRAGIFAPTDSGERLAQALDLRLREVDGYGHLRSLDKLTGTTELAKNLYSAWRIDRPSSREAEIFKRAFVDEGVKRFTSSLGERTATTDLIRSILKASKKPLSEDELRFRLTYSAPGALAKVGVRADNEKTQAIWRTLQVRQAQRYAFENILGWVELAVQSGCAHATDLVDNGIAVLRKRTDGFDARTWINSTMRAFEAGPGFGAEHDSPVHLLSEVAALQNHLWAAERDEAFCAAVRLLLLVSVLTRHLAQDAHAAPLLTSGGVTRVSLKKWLQFVEDHRQSPVDVVLSKVFENFVLSQHFAVAALRYAQDKRKLRLTIEDRGLVSLLDPGKDVVTPNITADRVFVTLSLLTECRVIARDVIDGQPYYASVD